MSIRVCIIDDHLLILDGIRRVLEAAEDIEIAAATHRGDEVAALVEALVAISCCSTTGCRAPTGSRA